MQFANLVNLCGGFEIIINQLLSDGKPMPQYHPSSAPKQYHRRGEPLFARVATLATHEMAFTNGRRGPREDMERGMG
jgi:hypothetical protein